MKTRRCLVCGSNEVILWLGGSIGAMYHCPACHYVGPVVIEGEGENLGDEPLSDDEEQEGAYSVSTRMWFEKNCSERE